MSEVCMRVRGRMEGHGFPGTLLPECMVEDRYDEVSGDFAVTLTGEVRLDVAGFPVRYDKRVSGVIRDGCISRLKGVKARQGFWIPITGIEVEGPNLVFVVGPIRKAVPLAAWGE